MRIFDGDGRGVGQNVQKGDVVIGELVGARIEDFDSPVGSLAPPERERDDRAHCARPHTAGRLDSWIVVRLGNQQGFSVLHYPAGHALADLDAQIAQPGFFPARGNRVVQFLRGFVQHQQRPQVGFNEALHVLDDGAQNRIQVEARSQRARHLVEDEKVVERNAAFRLFGHTGALFRTSVFGVS